MNINEGLGAAGGKRI